MNRRNCPLCGTQMVEQQSAKWAGKYECPECEHSEYDHSAIKTDYLKRTKIESDDRDIENEYANKEKV